MSWSITAEVGRFDEAVEQFRKRVPITAADLVQLQSHERRTAFWVAGMNEVGAVRTIHEELDRAIELGLPLEDFKKSVREKVLAAHALNGHHLDTVFRNAVQTAYNAGRWQQLTSPEATLVRPYFMYDAVLDTRTTPVCKQLDQTVKGHDDPFWLSRWPPLHHRCRSSVRSIRRSQGEGRVTSGDPAGEPQKGFGAAPPVRGEDPRPPPTPPEPEPPPDPSKPKRKRKKPQPAVDAIHAERERKALEAAAAEQAKDAARIEVLRRQEPAYWRKEYLATYEPEAADLVAYGRAMEERGRALAINDCLDEVDAFKAQTGIGFSPTDPRDTTRKLPPLDELLRTHAKGAVTMGEAIDRLQEEAQLLTAGSLNRLRLEAAAAEARVSAAVVAHKRAIKPIDKVPDAKRPKVTIAGQPGQTSRLAQSIADKSYRFYELLADKSVKLPGATFVMSFERARAFYSHKQKIISFDNARNAIHELGHGLDYHNRSAFQAARAFRRSRTHSDRDEKLADLFPNAGYKDNEWTRRDRFRDAYTGKLYWDNATEVTSTGIEDLAGNKAVELVQADPEHLYFVLGQLAGKVARK